MVSVPYGVMSNFSPAAIRRVPHRGCVPAVDVDLEREFTGEADPRDPYVDAAEGGVAPRHERERVVGDVEVGEHLTDHVAGAAVRRRGTWPTVR